MSKHGLFQDICYCPTVNETQKDGDIFVLIEHTYSVAFTNVIHSENLIELSSYLQISANKLMEKYENVKDYKVFYSKDNQLIAYQGIWFDEENGYFYEGGIIRANCLV